MIAERYVFSFVISYDDKPTYRSAFDFETYDLASNAMHETLLDHVNASIPWDFAAITAKQLLLTEDSK